MAKATYQARVLSNRLTTSKIFETELELVEPSEFHFKAGDLNFRSSSYDWLVVAGQDKAKYKGEGTINGNGGYGFMLTAVDNAASADPDTFRIKIWDKSADDSVLYDNKIGSSDDSYDGTEIGGGSIKIHKAK